MNEPTDEELSRIEDKRRRSFAYLYFAGQPLELVRDDIPRLIAALRAERAKGREWNDGYKAGYSDGYRSGQGAASPPPLPNEALILPNVQPDRAWAEHLGIPGLIAALRAERQNINELLAAHRAERLESARLTTEAKRLRGDVERNVTMLYVLCGSRHVFKAECRARGKNPDDFRETLYVTQAHLLDGRLIGEDDEVVIHESFYDKPAQQQQDILEALSIRRTSSSRPPSAEN